MKYQLPIAPGQYDPDVLSVETGLLCEDPSLTQQHQAEEADINTIVARFGLTGQLPVIPMPPLNADFDDVFDFQAAQNLIVQAKMSFQALPAGVRARFNNDPAAFVDFCSDPANMDEMVRMGLAVKQENDNVPVRRADSDAGAQGGASGAGARGVAEGT